MNSTFSKNTLKFYIVAAGPLKNPAGILKIHYFSYIFIYLPVEKPVDNVDNSFLKALHFVILFPLCRLTNYENRRTTVRRLCLFHSLFQSRSA